VGEAGTRDAAAGEDAARGVADLSPLPHRVDELGHLRVSRVDRVIFDSIVEKRKRVKPVGEVRRWVAGGGFLRRRGVEVSAA
jgi:hypothetical protein